MKFRSHLWEVICEIMYFASWRQSCCWMNPTGLPFFVWKVDGVKKNNWFSEAARLPIPELGLMVHQNYVYSTKYLWVLSAKGYGIWGILYHFNQFGCLLSPGFWFWPKSVPCPLWPAGTIRGALRSTRIPCQNLAMAEFSSTVPLSPTRWPNVKFRPHCPLSPPGWID